MGEGKRILIVSADDALGGMLGEELQAREGYKCRRAGGGAAALDALEDSHFDLILLDAGAADAAGGQICRRLRDAGVSAPLILLTVDDSEAATIAGLDAGATDYVVKPFKLGVLLARIRAHIRQFEHSDDAVLEIGPFAFSPGAKTLVRQDDAGAAVGAPLRLTDKEAQILKYLYMHAHDVGEGGEDGVVSREKLLGEVWGYNAGVTTHTLETHVYRLRQKMERDPSHAELLVTEPGGYRLALQSRH